jgi:uncharacterized protein (UPF0262 family)
LTGQTPLPQPDPAHARPAGLVRIIVEGEAPSRLSVAQEADRTQAIHDLEQENRFALPGRTGPLLLRLSLQEGRLGFDLRDAADCPVTAIGLALGPFRRLIKDYHLLIDAYETAALEGFEARVQAIDMGRRGLHDEGAALLQERLAGKAEMDFATARRLFTLVCALQPRI